MPQHKSAAKRMKTSRQAQQRNKRLRTMTHQALKAFKSEKTPDSLKAASRILDKAASKRVIHKNKAARLKSRLAKSSLRQAK